MHRIEVASFLRVLNNADGTCCHPILTAHPLRKAHNVAQFMTLHFSCFELAKAPLSCTSGQGGKFQLPLS